MSTSQPRGIRNFNPGNIDRSKPKRAGWKGAVPDSQLTDSRFEQFVAPEWGIRALARTLLTYHDKHRLKTVRGIINRWAPPVENDTGAYAAQVAAAVGVKPNESIDLHSYPVMRAIVVAIIKHENGQQPYSDLLIDTALNLAGITR